MSNLSNKYRPTKFEEVVSQNVTTTILNNMIKNNSYSNALLFLGPAGTGKTTCAKIFASYIDGEIFEIDSASNNGVKDVRQIVSYTNTKSITHKNKVIIFDEAHTLTSSAWASLLIPLEENKNNVVFIFCTTDVGKIPDTIISRLQKFNFIRHSDNEMFKRLLYITNLENINITEDAIKSLVYSAKGNLRLALNNLDKCLLYSNDLTVNVVNMVLNLVTVTQIKDLFNLMKTDKIKCCELIKELHNNGYNLYNVLEFSLNYFINESLRNNATNLNDINFIIVMMDKLKYMYNNPSNLPDFICAQVLLRKA